MKKPIYSFLLILTLTGGMSSIPASKAAAQQVSVSFQAFYDGLGPYGTWVNYPSYGYVWIPTAVPSGFRPYATGGHWAYTPDGWLWVSDYEWGWAVFHYGNWFYDESYGWMWAPGYDWAPAWVTWGEYEGNYCWAPIAPRLSVSIVSYRPPHYYWNFVPRQYITSSRINNYVRVNNTTVVNNITVINNTGRGGNGRGAFMRGPQPQSVERYTHTTIRPVQVREASRPERTQVQNGQLVVYRPVVNRNNTAKPAPQHVQDMHVLKRDNLPAADNRNVQPKTTAHHGGARPNANPGNNPAFNNNNRPSNTAPKPATRRPADNSQPVLPRPSPNDPVRNHPGDPDHSPVKRTNPTHNNKPVMNNLPTNNNRQPVTQPASRPATTPAPRANHPAPNPVNTRPDVPRQNPVQQPRPNPAPAAHPQPVHERPGAQPRERN